MEKNRSEFANEPRFPFNRSKLALRDETTRWIEAGTLTRFRA